MTATAFHAMPPRQAEPCPVCHGRKGASEARQGYHYRDDRAVWTGCQRCNATGVVEVRL
jgi:hypothetical protein